jgi:2'-5' RNA ligase
VDAAPTWEPWQHEYLHGALLIFPPADVARDVDRLREQHDARSAAICSAHVTVRGPVPRPLTDADVTELTAALSEVEPFDAHYGPLRVFAPHPGIAFEVTPTEQFDAIRAALRSTALFSDVDDGRAAVAPHMTIAEFITIERSEELLEELSATIRTGTFQCSELVYAVPDASFHFERVRTVRLGARRAP